MTGRSDKNKMNFNEKYEAEYWSKVFGVSTKTLKKAVQQVSTSANEFRKKLPSLTIA